MYEVRKTFERHEFTECIDGLTKQEIIADGIMVKNAALNSLPTKIHECILGITYRKRYDEPSSLKQDHELQLLAERVLHLEPKIQDKWFVVWALKSTVGDPTPEQQNLQWWSKHLSKSDRTMRRYMEFVRDFYTNRYAAVMYHVSAEFWIRGIVA
jgi:hypothetical protein